MNKRNKFMKRGRREDVDEERLGSKQNTRYNEKKCVFLN